MSLTLKRQTGTSILNIFETKIAALEEDEPGQVLVRLDAGGVPLLARITGRSAASLGLEPNKTVWAQVKTVAVLD